MRHKWSAAIAALTLQAGTSVVGAEPTTLQPQTPWNLRYDEQACRLVREFGVGDEAVLFTLAKYSPGSRFELMLSGKRMKPRGNSIRYRFLPTEHLDEDDEPLFGTSTQGVTTWQFTSGLIEHKQRDAFKKLPSTARDAAQVAADKARLAEIDAFEVKSGMERSFVLATGRLDKVFGALDTCLDDLVSTWGFDPAVQRALASEPEPRTDPSTWMSFEDYPNKPLAQDKSGIVRFRLEVGSDGRPTKCVVQAAYSDPEFEKTTCALLMKRARFEPAKDASGASVPSYWVSSVKWVVM